MEVYSNDQMAEEEDEPPGRRLVGDYFQDLEWENNINWRASEYLSGLYKRGVFKLNGESFSPSIFNNYRIKLLSQIDDVKSLWQQFSTQESLFDTWEFRYAFWQATNYPVYFMVLSLNGIDQAILPLWYEADKHKYYWFGSWWQEDNRFLTKDWKLIPLLIAMIPGQAVLNAILEDGLVWDKDKLGLVYDDPKYILNLDSITCLDDYFNSFNKKKRYNLIRDKRIIESHCPKIIFNNFNDFQLLIQLSNQRFNQKGETTDWEENPFRINSFKNVIELGQSNLSYQIRMITVRIGEQVAGVDLIAIYNRIYYPLKCGYDVANFPGIGNFFNLIEIEDALSLGMSKVDFLELNYGWKDRWFKEVPLLKYEV